jgi:hypothetical protein
MDALKRYNVKALKRETLEEARQMKQGRRSWQIFVARREGIYLHLIFVTNNCILSVKLALELRKVVQGRPITQPFQQPAPHWHSSPTMNRSIRRELSGLLLAALLSGFGSGHTLANQGAPPASVAQAVAPLATIPQYVLPPTDVQAELVADAQSQIRVPLRYAVARPVQITPASYGTWEQLPTGRLWRLRFISSGATDLNFGFTKFHLSEGATLYIISETNSYFQGPYTAAGNQPAEQLWTPVVPGEAAVIELFVPNGAEEPLLELTQVSTGYRDLFRQSKGLTNTKAGTCEIDVVCAVAAPWTNEIRSVGMISIGGIGFCSGTLIMDAPGDFRAFFLTANHCEITSGNASTVVVYWNFQSPTCGQHGLGGSLAQNTSGATFRASKTDVDFCLIELSQLPPSSYNVYYAGWDRSGGAVPGCVGIHHPNADGKCISFSSNPLTTVNSCIFSGGSSTHWQVTWTSAVTERGSSGSGIWTTNTHLLLGTLSGGLSDCMHPNSPDCYGKFSVAWGSGTTPASRLQDWLDPQNSGVTTKAGSNPVATPFISPVSATLLSEACVPANSVPDPGELVTINFTLKNNGTAPTTNLTATLLASNGVAAPGSAQNYGVLPVGGATVSRSFSFIASGSCGATINPTLQLQDGTQNLGSVSFSFTLGRPTVTTTQNFDGVAAPALPAGWSASPSGVWVTRTTQRDTPPNAVFASDPSSILDQQLTSPVFAISGQGSQLGFRQFYDLEPGYDGGVLEISINGGGFTDIISAGGTFITGDYSGSISTGYGNPLAGRNAWTGNSGGFVLTTVALPAVAASANVQFRWRLGSDSIGYATGWYVDTITLSAGYNCCGSPPRVTLSAPKMAPGKQFQFNVVGGTGFSYTILAASNLNTPLWVPLVTNMAPFSFTDLNTAGFPSRFYRVRSQ